MVEREKLDRFQRYMKYLRIAAGYTQVTFADELDVSNIYYQKLESGRATLYAKEYYAFRYIFENCLQGVTPMLRFFVDSKTVTDKERKELAKKMDAVIYEAGKRSGAEDRARKVMMCYNHYVMAELIEKKELERS